MVSNAEKDAPICYGGWALFPHAVPDILAAQTTHDREKVTCQACLWAMGSQKHEQTPEQ